MVCEFCVSHTNVGISVLRAAMTAYGREPRSRQRNEETGSPPVGAVGDGMEILEVGANWWGRGWREG